MGEYGGAVKEHWLLEGEAISGYKNEQWLDKKLKNINCLFNLICKKRHPQNMLFSANSKKIHNYDLSSIKVRLAL